MRKLTTKLAAFLALGVAASAAVLALPQPKAQAAPTYLEGFQAGNIITDQLMYNPGTMSEAQIQTFLSTQGAKCVKGTDGTPCIKNLKVDMPNLPATKYCPRPYVGGTAQPVSRIIHRAANACNINPQVLLVILQKEQGLVTTTNPTAKAVREAMGFRCPTGSACDPKYAGIGRQLTSAASRYQEYRIDSSRYNYRVGGTYSIQYHPNTACGSSKVTMQNAATAGLYNYTPFQPNKAALAGAYSAGDACSSWGNRNFYRLMYMWFGQRPNATTSTTPTQPPAPTIPSRSRHDATGDGKADLVEIAGGKIRVHELTKPISARKFDLAAAAKVGVGWNASNTIAAGDFSGDGRPDLILRNATGNLMLYRGTATGGWLAPVRIGVGWSAFDKIIGGHDFTGDGRPDLLARIRTNGDLYLYPGNGKGGFGASAKIGNGWQTIAELALVPGMASGRPAVVGITPAGTLYVYSSDGRGRFNGRKEIGNGWQTLATLQGLPDIDGNGAGELLATDSAGHSYLYPVSKASTIGSRATATSAVPPGTVFQTAGTKAPRVTYQVRPDGTLWRTSLVGPRTESAGYASVTAGIAADTSDLVIVPGDWNGDGRSDLIVRRSNGSLYLHAGISPTSWSTTGTAIGQGWGGFTSIIYVNSWANSAVGGLVAWNQSAGSVDFYPRNGSGGFGAKRSIGTGLTWANTIADAGNFANTADFRLLARRTSDGALLSIPSDSAGVLQPGSAAQVGVGWSGMRLITGIGDMTADGRDDFLAVTTGGEVRRYPGATPNKFGAPTKLALTTTGPVF